MTSPWEERGHAGNMARDTRGRLGHCTKEPRSYPEDNRRLHSHAEVRTAHRLVHI